MKKTFFALISIILLFIGTYFIFDLTRIKKRQSIEIKKKYKSDTFFIKDDLSDLPLLLFESAKPKSDCFIILLPGDGGWRDFIDTVAKIVSYRGIPVIGFNTIPYFSDQKKPKQIAKDLHRIFNNFSHILHKQKVILCGYSFGAEILPFVYNAMDTAEQNLVKKIILIAPSNLADFKVSTIYYYNPKYSLAVIPELNKLPAEKVLIICDRYKKNICKSIPDKTSLKTIKVDYGHLFIGGGRFMGNLISDQILLQPR